MATMITRPAALVRQGNLRLYATSFPVSDLMRPSFYDIDRLDPANPEDKGFQRLLDKARAKKLADYVVDGYESKDSFLPTSLFLATDKDIQFNSQNNTITFDLDQVGPFSVVDGQHRIEGLKLAREKCPELASFEVPVNIAVNLPYLAQMCHFLIVNTTQKSVDKAVEQRIYARLSKSIEFEDVPSLPRWIRRIVESGEDERALKIVDFLNSSAESPWRGKIGMANAPTKGATISQDSFVKAIKKYILVNNNPVYHRSADEQTKIMLNYWKAIANRLPTDGKSSVLYKYNGVELFSRFSSPLLTKALAQKNFKTETLEKLLSDAFENLDGEYAGVGLPDWWVSGTGQASQVNSAALNRINQELTKALHKVDSAGDIAI